MNGSFWVQSGSSLTEERRIVRPKCSLNLKNFRCLAPNRGKYNIAGERVITIRKITSVLFWFCPARQNYDDVDECCEYGNANYLKAVENNETITIPRLSEYAMSRTYTKKVIRRKCRPSLTNICNDFKTHEHFLKAVSILIRCPINLVNM